MSAETEPTFAGDFPPATEEQWLELVDKVLKGAPLSKLRSSTPGGVPVEPLYTRSGSPGAQDEAGFPGAAPFVRGGEAAPDEAAGWQLRSLVTAADPHDANRVALRELERGATELTVRFDAAFRAGLAPADDGFTSVAGVDGVLVTSTADLDALLEGVLLDVAPLHLQAGARFARAAELLVALWDRRGLDPDAPRRRPRRRPDRGARRPGAAPPGDRRSARGARGRRGSCREARPRGPRRHRRQRPVRRGRRQRDPGARGRCWPPEPRISGR